MVRQRRAASLFGERRPAGAAGTLLAALLALFLAACSGMPVSPTARALTERDLLAAAPIPFAAAHPDADLPDTDITALDDSMRTFLERNVGGGSDYVRLRMLLVAMRGPNGFRLEYDESTRTARDTFHSGVGNCLSFTTLFVGMARQLGLHVSYQEVDIPPSWTRRDDAFVLSRHVNARVELGQAGEHVVDFNMRDFRDSYPRTVISDARARAHYFNNLAVERLHAHDSPGALGFFRAALGADRSLAAAWNNLGGLYQRERAGNYAEASYLAALRADPHELVALSNLARLHERQGDRQAAEWFERRVVSHRLRNPYYRYAMAREAYENGDPDGAIGHLKTAIRLQKGDDSFYALLGLAYLKKGDREAARHWFAEGERIAVGDDRKATYHHRLDLLAYQPQRGPQERP